MFEDFGFCQDFEGNTLKFSTGELMIWDVKAPSGIQGLIFCTRHSGDLRTYKTKSVEDDGAYISSVIEHENHRFYPLDFHHTIFALLLWRTSTV